MSQPIQRLSSETHTHAATMHRPAIEIDAQNRERHYCSAYHKRLGDTIDCHGNPCPFTMGKFLLRARRAYPGVCRSSHPRVSRHAIISCMTGQHGVCLVLWN